MLIETSDGFYPLEIKKTATPSRTATKNFSLLEKSGRTICEGALLCLIEKDIPLSNKVTAIPVNWL